MFGRMVGLEEASLIEQAAPPKNKGRFLVLLLSKLVVELIPGISLLLLNLLPAISLLPIEGNFPPVENYPLDRYINRVVAPFVQRVIFTLWTCSLPSSWEKQIANRCCNMCPEGNFYPLEPFAL